MKKIYALLGAMALAMPLAAAANTRAAAPDALYLVGGLNDWTLPGEGGTQFPLTDPDGDGVYTGTYKIDSDLYFKIFDSPTTVDWNDAYGVDPVPVLFPSGIYKDEVYSVEVVKCKEGRSYVDAMYIRNWKGGNITFSAKASDSGYALELTSAAAPQWPSSSVRAFLIGDFNNWAIPDKDATNGAIELPEVGPNPGIFSADVECGAGDFSFAFVTCYESGAVSYYYFSTIPSFILTVPGAKTPTGYEYAPIVYGEAEKVMKGLVETPKRSTLRNWDGGKVRFYLNAQSELFGVCPCGEIPVMSPPSDIRAIVQRDGGEPKLEQFGYDYISVFQGFVGANYSVNDSNIALSFTTENSLTPSPENVWGVPDDFSITATGDYLVPIVKGGKPLDFNGFSVNLYVTWYYNYGYANITAKVYPDPSKAEHLYLDGYQVNWVAPSEANKDMLIEFNKVAPGVFEKVVECPYREPNGFESAMQFRFFFQLLGWTSEASLGSALPDFYSVDADMSQPAEYEIVQQGLSNWGLTNWEGGPIYMRVNLNDMTLYLNGDLNSVEQLDEEALSEAPRYYNIQGVEIPRPEQGLCIVRRGNKTEKVLFR